MGSSSLMPRMSRRDVTVTAGESCGAGSVVSSDWM